MGDMLRATEKNKGARAGGKKTGSRGSYREPRDKAPTYKQAGLGKKWAADAQVLAVPSWDRLRSPVPSENR